jgi:hypothetical protein
MSATRIKLAEMERVNERLQKDLRARQREIEAQQQAEQAERDRLNTEARNHYLAEQQVKEDAIKAQVAARLAAERAGVKAERQRAWLIEHPGQTAATFDKTIWPLIEEQLFGRDAAIKREIEAQRERMGGRF